MLFFFYRVKFVGLFIILFVGMVTIKDLWDIYGNVQNSLVSDSLSLFIISCSALHIASPSLLSGMYSSTSWPEPFA